MQVQYIEAHHRCGQARVAVVIDSDEIANVEHQVWADDGDVHASRYRWERFKTVVEHATVQDAVDAANAYLEELSGKGYRIASRFAARVTAAVVDA